jgi:hypothetical protein
MINSVVSQYRNKTPPITSPRMMETPFAIDPRLQFHRPWYVRFMAKGCNRCGGEPYGWVQKQIQTPYRFKRCVLWVVNLVPRGFSFVRVITSRRVDSERYVERQAACGACPSAVIQIRVVRGLVRETSYCGMCECPKWRPSRNAVRNWRSAWKCPAKLHVGSDSNAHFVEYLRSKTESAGNGRAVDGTDRGGRDDG